MVARKNKDDNIHKSEALGQTDINFCIVSELNNYNKSRSKIVSWKTAWYRIMFMDILTFLGLDYRVASLIILFLVVPGSNIPKIRPNG